jgi:hypothetical protein
VLVLGRCSASEVSGWRTPGWLKIRPSPAALARRVKAMATVWERLTRDRWLTMDR